MSQLIVAANQQDFIEFCRSRNITNGFRVRLREHVLGIRGKVIITDNAHLGDSYYDLIGLLREIEKRGGITIFYEGAISVVNPSDSSQ